MKSLNNKDNNQNNNKRRPTRVELYDTPKPGEEKKKRSFFNRKPKQTTPNHKHKTASPNKKKNPYGISRRMFKVILGCLLVDNTPDLATAIKIGLLSIEVLFRASYKPKKELS